MAAGTKKHCIPWPSIKPAAAVAAALVLDEEFDQRFRFILASYLLFYYLHIVFPNVFGVHCIYYAVVCQLIEINPNSRSFAGMYLISRQ